jgi:hypothetical protein
MARKYKERSLIEFQKTFSDYGMCAKCLIEQRWPEGYIYPNCGHNQAWYFSK